MYKQLKFKARRGMLELDLLLNNYIDNNFEQLSEELQHNLLELLDLSDPELLSLLIYESDINNNINNKFFNIINNIREFKKQI